MNGHFSSLSAIVLLALSACGPSSPRQDPTPPPLGTYASEAGDTITFTEIGLHWEICDDAPLWRMGDTSWTVGPDYCELDGAVFRREGAVLVLPDDEVFLSVGGSYFSMTSYGDWHFVFRGRRVENDGGG